jgi:serine/threonine protein kinase
MTEEEALHYSRHLIMALDHLHSHKIAHLDVNPSNVAFDRPAQRLILLDFDIAIKLENEDDTITGYRGTEGWTAPEVGDPDGEDQTFRPMLADLWACGQMVDFFFKEETHPLRELTKRLTADPEERPSMGECLSWIKTGHAIGGESMMKRRSSSSGSRPC